MALRHCLLCVSSEMIDYYHILIWLSASVVAHAAMMYSPGRIIAPAPNSVIMPGQKFKFVRRLHSFQSIFIGNLITIAVLPVACGLLNLELQLYCVAEHSASEVVHPFRGFVLWALLWPFF